MGERQIENTVKTAASSLEMEGFFVDAQAKAWCKQLLRKEITLDEYIKMVKEKAGVSA